MTLLETSFSVICGVGGLLGGYFTAIQWPDPKPRHVDTPFEKAMEELDHVPIEPTRDPTFAGATTDERRYDAKG